MTRRLTVRAMMDAPAITNAILSPTSHQLILEVSPAGPNGLTANAPVRPLTSMFLTPVALAE